VSTGIRVVVVAIGMKDTCSFGCILPLRRSLEVTINTDRAYGDMPAIEIRRERQTSLVKPTSSR